MGLLVGYPRPHDHGKAVIFLGVAASAGDTMHALVIDDSRTVRAIIGGILAELGLNVVEAANGREGLERLQQNPDIGLVLVDWNMPEMNGLEFIQAVRKEPGYDSLHIVMVTTETEQEQLLRALEAGANEYVMKPFTREILVAKLSLLGIPGE
jgi:two-component system chemotaxis response regulator CheY